MRGVMLAFLLLAPIGCLNRMMGAGSDAGYEVAQRLERGMTVAEVHLILGTNGLAETRIDESNREGDWSALIEDDAEREALLAVAAEHQDVSRYVVVDRLWGMIGWDRFRLYLDEADRLLDFEHTHFD